MKILRFVYLIIAQAFYRRAMQEINPLHPDVPLILMRQRELNDEARRLLCDH